MKKFKLNALDKQEMDNLRGGVADDPKDLIIPPRGYCSCACRWVDQGGSSTGDNNAANKAGGLHSV